MVFIGERCYKLHRMMFIFMGLWPYQKPFIWRIQAVIFFMIFCGCFLFQFTPFLTTTCDIDCILKRYCYISICLVYLMSYYCFYFNSEMIKHALEHVQLDWKMFENSDAIKILEDYLHDSYILALCACAFLFTGMFTFLTVECGPVIFDVIIPINETRPRTVEIDLETFIDKDKYFFVYIVEELLGLGTGLCTVVTTGTFLNMIGKHCCATYKIASCLIQNTVIVHTLQIPIDQKIQFMHRSICLSVYIHRRTMELINHLVVSLDLWYLPLLALAVLSLSCFLFRLYNAIMRFNDYYDIFVSSSLLNGYLLFTFLANFYGQAYTEHSIELIESTYNSLWYLAPLPIQKLFLIMQRSVKSHKIVMGGLFTLSIEGFSTLITSAVSYFTVIHAMHS
ncbi:hypothetical protein DMN91_010193 [Ooceraea biroi]|uniref:Odorant receptor n=1 Tax=Ooceraea biroi TaxID=2015173 RepID=A0A026W2P1_OOCBI|nr:hypothetical protein X777_11279 [Ooceraea biroi]RLU17953.1 hypothetical protein DMN91_010193 [Ooceraea biroi]